MSISKLTLHHLEHFIKPNLQETRRWNYELGLIFSYQILAFMLNYLFEQATNTKSGRCSFCKQLLQETFMTRAVPFLLLSLSHSAAILFSSLY